MAGGKWEIVVSYRILMGDQSWARVPFLVAGASIFVCPQQTVGCVMACRSFVCRTWLGWASYFRCVFPPTTVNYKRKEDTASA